MYDGSLIREVEISAAAPINALDLAADGVLFVAGGDDRLIKASERASELSFFLSFSVFLSFSGDECKYKRNDELGLFKPAPTLIDLFLHSLASRVRKLVGDEIVSSTPHIIFLL